MIFALAWIVTFMLIAIYQAIKETLKEVISRREEEERSQNSSNPETEASATASTPTLYLDSQKSYLRAFKRALAESDENTGIYDGSQALEISEEEFQSRYNQEAWTRAWERALSSALNASVKKGEKACQFVVTLLDEPVA